MKVDVRALHLDLFEQPVNKVFQCSVKLRLQTELT
jgi:hypothetical protein